MPPSTTWIFYDYSSCGNRHTEECGDCYKSWGETQRPMLSFTPKRWKLLVFDVENVFQSSKGLIPLLCRLRFSFSNAPFVFFNDSMCTVKVIKIHCRKFLPLTEWILWGTFHSSSRQSSSPTNGYATLTSKSCSGRGPISKCQSRRGTFARLSKQKSVATLMTRHPAYGPCNLVHVWKASFNFNIFLCSSIAGIHPLCLC